MRHLLVLSALLFAAQATHSAVSSDVELYVQATANNVVFGTLISHPDAQDWDTMVDCLAGTMTAAWLKARLPAACLDR